MSKLIPHPFSTLVEKMMSDTDLKELADRISRFGLREKGKLFQGMILDGRHRAAACKMVGVEMKWEEFQGTEREAFEYVIDQNFSRRHMNAGERVLGVAAINKVRELRDWPMKSGQSSPPIGGLAKSTVEVMAETAQVSKRTMERGLKIESDGIKPLKTLTVQGKVSIGAAAKVAALPKQQQKTIVAQGPAAVRSAARDYSDVYTSAPAPRRQPIFPPGSPHRQNGNGAAAGSSVADNAAALAALETSLKDDVRRKQWAELFVAKIEACYEANKSKWNQPPPPTPRQIIDTIVKAVRA